MRRTSELQEPGLRDQFVPKLVTVLREGYTLADLRADVQAALTVAIVALPLSMAIAIASGVGPDRGLVTAIVGGFLISALGGSRFQIGGPAGAFIVLVAACVADIGVSGLVLATLLSGGFLVLAGGLRLGTYVKFIPYPVTVGFTAGIAVIILASQMHDLLGLTLAGPEPSALLPKIAALWYARDTVTSGALLLSAGTVLTIVMLKRLRPHWPGLLIAVAGASVLAFAAGLQVETVGTRFGALPRGLPPPALPDLGVDSLRAALPYAVSFALLGAIESLLSAVVADGMSGRRHRSNAELVAQGIANMGSALFGGIPATGTIARTATNVRAGSHGPVSGILHAVFILLFMLVAAPLASYIPLAALAGVLAVVAWNMAEKEAIWTLLRTSRGDAAVLIVTFLLVTFRDLTEGIVVGFLLGALLFIRRMSDAARVEEGTAFVSEDMVDEVHHFEAESTGDVMVYHVKGALFFGAAATVGSVLERIAERPKAMIVDLEGVPFLDSSGAHSIELLARKVTRAGGRLILTGLDREKRRVLQAVGIGDALAEFAADVPAARALLRQPVGVEMAPKVV